MNSLKICLLHTPKPYVVKSPPQGLMSIAAYLKSKNIKIEILDANIHYIDVDAIKLDSFENFKNNKRGHIFKLFNSHFQEFPQEELKEYFSKNKFDVIISDCHYTGTDALALRTFELIKEILPNCIIISGGIHSSLYYEQLLNSKLIDIIVKGEGEEVIYQIIQNLENGESLNNIEGINYLEGEHIKINSGMGFIKDLNSLAPVFEVYDDFEMELYRDYVKAILGPFWYDEDPTGLLVLSRGCIGRCSFCNSRIVDQGKYRSLNEENTLRILNSVYELYSPKNFKICDAMFGANIKQFKTVCDFMREVEIPWSFGTRIDALKTRELDLLKGSYCKEIFFGLESVHLDTLKFNQKISHKKTDEYLLNGVKTLKDVMGLGISCFVALIFGLPTEKKTVYEDTIKFFKDNDLVSEKLELIHSVPVAFPGTLLWDLTPQDQRCYDFEKFFLMLTPDDVKESGICYVDPNFTFDELQYYAENISKDLFEKSDLTDKQLLLKDLRKMIDEGYDAIESEMDKEWFKLSMEFTLESYLSSKK